MLIVVERRETFHYYYPMGVHPPGDLTVTIELVDMAMLKIREYPDKGALYCEIISKAYLNRFKYRESEMLEVLNMERSTYYDRKKEAILLFGLSLWGTAIPKLKDFLESAREEEALCYCEC